LSDTRFFPAKEFVERAFIYTDSGEVARGVVDAGTEMQRLRNHRVGIAEACGSDRDALIQSVATCAALAAIFIDAVVERDIAGGRTH
jgi:hypothetical protein